MRDDLPTDLEIVQSLIPLDLHRAIAAEQAKEIRKAHSVKLSEVRKTVITALGVVVSLGSFALPYVTDLAPEYANIIGCVIGVATVVLNYLVPNETDDPERAIGRSVRVKGEKPVEDQPAPVEEIGPIRSDYPPDSTGQRVEDPNHRWL